MVVGFSPLVLMGLAAWFGLRGVLTYGKLFLLGSRFFGMLLGQGFVMISPTAVLVRIGSMFMVRFLLALIGRAACC